MANTALTIATPIVTLMNGQAFANSLTQAEFFGKRHDYVRDSIRKLIEDAPSCSLNFQETWVDVSMPNGGTRLGKTLDMTKDGLTILAMGFTGTKALEFKLRDFAAFNELEAKANAAVMALPDFTNPAAAARAWGDEVEQKSLGLSSSLLSL